MISGADYKKRTRTRFVVYAVIAGPLLGLGVCLCLLIPFGLYERAFGGDQNQAFAFLPVKLALQWFFVIGTGPALVTALYAMYKFTSKQGIEWGDILTSAAFGAVVGNFAAMVMAVKITMGERSDVISLPVLIFLIALPLFVSPFAAFILWMARPKQWIGPLTAEELAQWREGQERAKPVP